MKKLRRNFIIQRAFARFVTSFLRIKGGSILF